MSDEQLKKLVGDKDVNANSAKDDVDVKGCGTFSCKGMCYVAGACRHCITSSGKKS